jgi:hypothetical protein
MASAVQPEPDDPRWVAALRVAGSHTFERSHRLQSFLLDVAGHAITGRSDEISEQQIGIRVFGKSTGYNPAEDNTVRVQARLLRHKLEEYYTGEGANDALRIQIPKGGYVPVFGPPVEEPVREAPAPVASPAVRVNRVLLVLCVLLASAVAWLLLGWRAPEPHSAAVEHGSLTGLVVGPARKTVVVLADSGLVAAETLSGQDVSLAEYTGSGYRFKMDSSKVLTGPAAHFWGYLLSRRYTSMADVQLFGRLLQLHPEAWKNMEVRHSRDLQVRDFRENNFILLGSNRSTPWLELFNDKLDFQFDAAPTTHIAFIRNKHPRVGEPAGYYMDAMPNGTGEGYGYVAEVSNLTDTGSVLIIAGTTMAATDAAAEFACDPKASQTLARQWGLPDLHSVKSFELVFDTAIVSDTAKSNRIVASRHTLVRKP